MVRIPLSTAPQEGMPVEHFRLYISNRCLVLGIDIKKNYSSIKWAIFSLFRLLF